MIYLTGDTHATEIRRLNSQNFPATDKDYIIILGDFGLLWNDSKEERYWTNWLNEKPFVTLWISGNHENHVRIAQLPRIKMFGSEVGKMSDKIYHLITGNCYQIEGKSFFVFGGASSIDKAQRIPYKSWWPEEIPSYQDFSRALATLETVGGKVDYFLAHTCPKHVADKYLEHVVSGTEIELPKFEDPTEKMLSELVSCCQFKKFYFGHWHDSWVYENYQMLYQNIASIEH